MSRKLPAAVLVLLVAVAPARATFHIAQITEVMSGAAGNPNLQYVEIRMLTAGQSVIANTLLTAFSCDGSTVSEMLVVPGPNLVNGAAGARWIMASPDAVTFLVAAGVTPDRVWNATVTGGIPVACGQVCWGAPGILSAPPPASWDHTNPNNYVDCIAYGPYTGPPRTGVSPVAAPAGDDVHSLTRNDVTGVVSLACPTPQNNANLTGGFGACSPPTVDNYLSGKKLLLTDDPADATRRKLKVLSKDLTANLGAGNGSADDPVVHGGSLRIVSTSGDTFDATYALPAANWIYLGPAGAGIGYKYLDKLQANGPIKLAIIKAGKLVKAVGAGAALSQTLAGNPDPVSVTLQTGGLSYCATLGGTVKHVAPKKFVAKDADPPGGCAP
jgi:hypothetical protein